jgi:chemotaxis protein methyltransferase CheR
MDTSLTPGALVADPLFPILKERIIRRTGLAYYSDRDNDLATRLLRRLSRLGLRGCAPYMSLLESASGAVELDALVGELTIGETYFFRYREQFDALRRLVLPDLIRRKAESRSLKIWSAGCATGPEPYSIAILLERHFKYDLDGWNVSIVGTDINPQFLERARSGAFDDWAMRSIPEDLRRGCFRRIGETWQIDPLFQSRLTFRQHNLVEDAYPSQVHGLHDFDLILCRNVMIYFTPDVIEQMVLKFQNCLTPGGWFFVGHAELNMEWFRSFRSVSVPGACLYQNLSPEARRPGVSTPRFTAPPVMVQRAWVTQREEPASRPAAKPLASAFPAAPPRLTARPERTSLPAPASPQPAPAPTPEGTALAEARRLADRGDWLAAERECRDALERDRLDAAAHFLLGLVLHHRGNAAEAQKSLRQAIYLDRSFALAHYHLAQLLRERGDPTAARRSYENCRALLARLRDDQAVAHGDGMTAADLRDLIQMHLEALSA